MRDTISSYTNSKISLGTFHFPIHIVWYHGDVSSSYTDSKISWGISHIPTHIKISWGISHLPTQIVRYHWGYLIFLHI